MQAAGGVEGIGEAEVGGNEGVAAVLEDGDRLVGPGRGVVDAGHVDRDRVGGWVEFDPSFFHAAAAPDIYTLSLHDALPIFGRRAEDEVTEVGDRDDLADGDRDAE